MKSCKWRAGAIRYIALLFISLVFVIFYVFQNIEVMKIKLHHKGLIESEADVIRKNDRLLYEIERSRRMNVIERSADKRGLRNITPNDFVVLKVKPDNEK